MKRMFTNEKQSKKEEPCLEDLLKTVSAEKLREFIITQAKHNEEWFIAVLFEFAVNAENVKGLGLYRPKAIR